jgi:hypothetical protein
MCVLNTLAIVLCVALARRRGGLFLMFATALGIALMCQSLPGEAMHDIGIPPPACSRSGLDLRRLVARGRVPPAAARDSAENYVIQTHLNLAPAPSC